MKQPGNEPLRKGIAFRPEDYKEAAEEHIVTAQNLLDARAYVLSIYVAGVAVEAIFRGFFARKSREFDAKHDLHQWSQKIGFMDMIPPSNYEKYSAALANLEQYWRNDHRYRSQSSLTRYYKRMRQDREIKGDVVKEIARRTVSAALEVIALGRERWKN